MLRLNVHLQHHITHQFELPCSLINTNTESADSSPLAPSTIAALSTSDSASPLPCLMLATLSQKLILNLMGMRVLRSLEVWKLGVVKYMDALKLQEKLVLDRKSHRICDTLLSLQHPPTYTVGKRQTVHNLLIPQSDLEQIGAELHYTQRGGDITFHGPHQAILYPIISLRNMGLGARSYVEKIELTMIELAALYGVKACPGQTDETGVWVGERKIGAIGVRISNGITSHGMAFNIDPDLTYFRHIVPCGIADKEVTSLKRETDFLLPAEEVIQEQLISCFARIFGYDNLIWKVDASIFTGKNGTE